MKNGLASKLTSAFGLLSLTPLILVGIIAVYGLRLAHEQDIAAMERSALRQKSEEVSKFISDITGLFEIRVGYDGNYTIVEADQKFLLEKLLQENKFILEAAFADPSGMETKKLSRLQNAELMGLNDISGLKKFKVAKSGQTFLGTINETSEGPLISVSGPVINKNGEVVMVVTGEISLASLEKQFSVSSLGNAGYIYAVDNGKIAAGSQGVPVGRDVQSLAPEFFRKDMLSGPLQTRRGILGTDVYTLKQNIVNPNWILVAEWPVTDANANIADLRDQFAVFSGAVLLLVILIGWLVGRRIVGPLLELKKGADKFGGNELNYLIKVNTGDEIEDLAGVMNKMASDLKKQMTEIESSHKKIEENLREINKLKDDFIFVAAHELRSPVTVLQGYVSEIIDDKKTVAKLKKMNPYFVDMVKGIEVSKDRLSTLVDDLLNIARMEAGKFKINIRENVDINESVKPVIETLKELCKPRQIKLVFKTEGKIPSIKVDPDRVNELLTNLISNAIKYNKDKGTITVTASYRTGRIYFAVADTGIGLDDEEQKHLFEKFWRSDNVSKLQGTGLGLFIVKHMIEQMGGNISFESKKNVGTTFRFDLPAA